MNCLDRVGIQRFIDSEVDDLRRDTIESHLQQCSKCKELYETAVQDKRIINEFVSQTYSEDEIIAVPKFDLKLQKKKSAIYRVASSLSFKVAASVAFLIGLFLILRSNVSPPVVASEDADLIMLELFGNTEPNKAWHNGQMVFVIVDENGEVIQSFLSE
jgi:anti-sigma factor RsiW